MCCQTEVIGLLTCFVAVLSHCRSPAALIVQHLYHNKYLTTINFIEEALPFTDIIPTATIGENDGKQSSLL